MFETQNNSSLRLEVSDTTVSILPGTARIGNYIMPYSGGRTFFSDITDFGGDTSKYQYSALYLENFNAVADLTSSVSTTVDTIAELVLPELPYDSSNPYAPVHALGLFTFWTSDGTDVSLVNLDRI